MYLIICNYCGHTKQQKYTPFIGSKCDRCSDSNLTVKKYKPLDTYAGAPPFPSDKKDNEYITPMELDSFTGDYGSYGEFGSFD